MDHDIEHMTRVELKTRLRELRAAVRLHRDQKGDDRCWMDDEILYHALPEGYTVPERDTTVELAHCERFIRCRMNPKTRYVSPQRRIEELEARVKELEHENDLLQAMPNVPTDSNGRGDVPHCVHPGEVCSSREVHQVQEGR